MFSSPDLAFLPEFVTASEFLRIQPLQLVQPDTRFKELLMPVGCYQQRSVLRRLLPA
jgi:hypothetical protein